MRIAGVASAFPQNYYPQAEIAAALKRHWSNESDRPEVPDRMLARVGGNGRHLALPIDHYDDLTDWGTRTIAGSKSPRTWPNSRSAAR